MRILTINVMGIPSGSSSDLVSANVFQDYNALVVNPISLESLWGYNYFEYYNPDDRTLTSKSGEISSRLSVKRGKQVIGLLKRGGVVVCFMQPLIRYTYKHYYQGKERQSNVTNYDWLPEDIYSESGTIILGRGQTIDYIDSGHPFSEYLNIIPSWSAYIEKDDCEDWKILASAFNTHAVSLAKRAGLGHIILLPSYYDYHNGELLERCIVKMLGERETRPQPSWAKAILVSGQEELISKITHVNKQVSALEKEREALIGDNNKLERWKYLLYEKGKHQLEPVVRDALALLGCTVEPQPDKDSDGVVICDYGTALLEIVGSKGTIKIEKLGELTKNMGNFITKKGIKVKGILVGNPFCDDPLDNRPPINSQKKPFAKELIESAEQQSITVLLTTDLYEVVSRILKGEPPKPEKQSLQQHIFSGKGLVRLV